MKQGYYYQHMDKNEQAAYRAMKEGLESMAPEFPVPRLEGRALSEVFFRLRFGRSLYFLCRGVSLPIFGGF